MSGELLGGELLGVGAVRCVSAVCLCISAVCSCVSAMCLCVSAMCVCVFQLHTVWVVPAAQSMVLHEVQAAQNVYAEVKVLFQL